MNPEMILTFIILLVTILLFITDKFRIDIVATLTLLTLVLTNLITTEQALAGFANGADFSGNQRSVGAIDLADVRQLGVVDWFNLC